MNVEPKTTVNLPFSPEDVAAGRVTEQDDLEARHDAAWNAVRNEPRLQRARQRLSLDEMRLLIRTVVKSFQ